MQTQVAYVLAGRIGKHSLLSTGKWPSSDFKRFVERNTAEPFALNDTWLARLVPLALLDRSPLLRIAQIILAWTLAGRCDRFRAIVCSGEDIGLPLALFCRMRGKSVPVIVITHGPILRKPAYRWMLNRVKSWPLVRFACLSQSLAEYISRRHGVPPAIALGTGYGIDTEFFSAVSEGESNRVVSAGASHRDYPTLVEACVDQGVELKIAAHSRWFANQLKDSGPLPEFVECRSWGDYSRLRELYDSASLIAVPTFNAPAVKGLAVIGEALAMGRPVIASDGEVNCDFIVEGHNGLRVPAGDPQAMRRAIRSLLDDPARMAEMGRKAKAIMRERFSLDSYCNRLESVIEQVCEASAESLAQQPAWSRADHAAS